MQGGMCEWDGTVNQAANTILHQHAIQGDINDLQVIISTLNSKSSWSIDINHNFQVLSSEMDPVEIRLIR